MVVFCMWCDLKMIKQVYEFMALAQKNMNAGLSTGLRHNSQKTFIAIFLPCPCLESKLRRRNMDIHKNIKKFKGEIMGQGTGKCTKQK